MSLRNKLELIVERKYKFIVFLLLTANVLLAIYIRLIGISFDSTSLDGTDSVRYVHQAKQIVEQGRMPETDTFRSAPVGEETFTKLTLYPYVVAAIYKISGNQDRILVYAEM